MNTIPTGNNVQNVNRFDANQPPVEVNKKTPSIWPITLIIWFLSGPIIYFSMIIGAKSSNMAGWMALLGWIVVIPMQFFHLIILAISVTLVSLIRWQLKYILLPTFVSFLSLVFGLIAKTLNKTDYFPNSMILITLLSSILISLIYHFYLRKKCKNDFSCESLKWDNKYYLWLILAIILPIFSFFQFVTVGKDTSTKMSKLNRQIISQSGFSSSCEVFESIFNDDGQSAPKVSQSIKCIPQGENVNNMTLYNDIKIEYLPGHQQWDEQSGFNENCVDYFLSSSIMKSKICVNKFRGGSSVLWIQGDYEFSVSGTFGSESTGWGGQDTDKLNELTKNLTRIIVEKNSDLF